MSMFDWSHRLTGVEEHMDRADCPEAQLLRTVEQFKLVNRLFARYRHILTAGVLRTMRRDPGRRYRLSDLGAGGGDIDRWLIGRCRRDGLKLDIIALDRDPRIVRYAAAANAGYPEIKTVEADALDVAAWEGPDFVFANHLLHHLPDDLCVALLQTLDRAALIGYSLGDLARSRLAAWGFRCVATPFSARSFLAADGVLSIRRGFTRSELEAMIERSDLRRRPRVKRLWPARLVLECGYEPP